MAEQAKIYFQDQLAGYLVEGDSGYAFSYDKGYLETPIRSPITNSSNNQTRR